MLSRGPAILVVEDEPAVAELLSHVLSGEGRIIDSAADGQEALDMVGKKRYDRIIMDLRMPGLSGQEVYRHIRDADPALARKIIFVTGDTVRSEAREFLQETGNPVLSKPFDLSELRRLVQDSEAQKES